jgi:hypothetical protein
VRSAKLQFEFMQRPITRPSGFYLIRTPLNRKSLVSHPRDSKLQLSP